MSLYHKTVYYLASQKSDLPQGLLFGWPKSFTYHQEQYLLDVVSRTETEACHLTSFSGPTMMPSIRKTPFFEYSQPIPVIFDISLGQNPSGNKSKYNTVENNQLRGQLLLMNLKMRILLLDTNNINICCSAY